MLKALEDLAAEESGRAKAEAEAESSQAALLRTRTEAAQTRAVLEGDLAKARPRLAFVFVFKDWEGGSYIIIINSYCS